MVNKTSKKAVQTLFVIIGMLTFLLIFGLTTAFASPRPSPPEESVAPSSSASLSSAPLYCSSWGGSHAYEYISDVSYTVHPGGTMTVTVDIYIANPTGCTFGQPCPEYDNSPEYINVWVDWNGNFMFDQDEKVIDVALTGYSGINYRGTMTATRIVTIPDEAVANTWMRTNLGWDYDPNDPCTLSWVWGDVEDEAVILGSPVEVVQLDALEDIDIHNVWDPIWTKEYPGIDPIADDMKSGSFKVKATLDSDNGKPSWSPKVQVYWSLPGVYGQREFTGWSGDFDVFPPQKVGSYQLKLDFIIRDDQDNIVSEQTIMRKLYVTHGKPPSWLSPLKEKWLEKATEWANGAKKAWEVTTELNEGIYSESGWDYRDPPEGSGGILWESLVEGLESKGNCVSFSNVWSNLSKVLGVKKTRTQRTYGQYNKGFVTKPATALDGLKGNAHPAGGSVDRWMFGMHQVGKYGTRYYDPTFGGKYSGIFDFISWHVTGYGQDSLGRYAQTTDGHKVYWRSDKAPWGDYEYHSPTDSTLPSPFLGASFTGNYSEQGLDVDGNGIYNFLTVEPEIDVSAPGSYSVFGLLRFGETIIASRSSMDSMGFAGTEWAGEPGLTNVVLTFSGEDIDTAGLDGVYTVDLWLLDENGVLIDTSSFDTSPYAHEQFREVPAAIIGSLDFGQDLDGDGLYDYLTADVSIDVISPMSFAVEATLSSQDNLISSRDVKTDLGQGSNIVRMDFQGQEIERSNVDGPYTLTISVLDANGHQIGQKEFETAAFQSTDFEQNAASFSGSYSDHPVDVDGDGLYDYLIVTTEVDVNKGGNYHIVGWLSDGQGNAIAVADNEIGATSPAPTVTGSPSAEAESVLLRFDGLTIRERALDGPYSLEYIVLKDSGDVIKDHQEDAYATSFYRFTDFQRPEEPLIALTGDYADFAHDADGDGTPDHLTIEVSVIAANPGNVGIMARLMDTSGEEISWAENIAYLEGGQPQTIQLNFDGEAIYSHKVDGPYYVRDVYIYHTGDPLKPDYVYEAHTTAPYAYALFGGNVPPTAEANGPYFGAEGSPVTFDGSGSSDPDGDTLQYRWDFEDDGSWDTDWLSEPTATNSWNDDHTGTARLEVSDGDVESQDTATVTINNALPIVDVGPDRVVDEGEPLDFLGSFTDPGVLDTHTIEWDFGNSEFSVGTLSATHVYRDNGVYAVTLTVTDDDGGVGQDTLQVEVVNVDPYVGEISVPVDPEAVGDPVSVNASFADEGILDTHTAVWSWGDSTTSVGTVDEDTGEVIGSHAYTTAGVYTVELTVTDDDDGVGTATSQEYLVIYDADGGFVTGGGWIDSPEGAYAPDPTLTGKANFGFVSKYKKGASIPTGETEFQFKVADLDFHSTSYDWLVIAGARAQYKGDGTINGEGDFGFMLTAIDSALPGGGVEDKFRIKIWDKNTDTVVYDNQIGEDDDADLSTALGGGSIVIHKK